MACLGADPAGIRSLLGKTRFPLLPKGQILASKRSSEAGHLGGVQAEVQS
jgi:hypothetical protein